jgi:glucose-6-phosphate 1-dehydrogenase
MTTPRSDALVCFGASGNLAFKSIFPALQGLALAGQLDVPVIGVARTEWTRDEFIERARASLEAHGGVHPQAFEILAQRLDYICGEYTAPETYQRLRGALGKAQRPLYYLAIPPSLFDDVARGLAEADAADGARVVVEKPFGRDLTSSTELDSVLHQFFPEPSIFRIDHFLGKEAVQNLLYFRFANSFLEPIWNRDHIARIEVTMAESYGVKGRGLLYEELGLIRDVVQNHLLQVVALLVMEPPVGQSSEALRDAKGQAFHAMRPMSQDDVVRGQFRGYRGEPGVAPESEVETFAALRLFIDSWRWSGVPIYIRAGKCLAVTATEVFVVLKHPPYAIFDDVNRAPANHVRFRLSPDVVIEVGARAKRPGEAMAGEEVLLDACRNTATSVPAYQRLLGDAMRGDQMLFARTDSVEAAWRVVEPVLATNVTPIVYEPGSWGPPEAEALLGGPWHDPDGA